MNSQHATTQSVFGPSSFVSQFLSERGLDGPTGVPLYGYHPSREDFRALEQCLRADADRLRQKGLTCIPSRHIGHALLLYLAMKVAFDYEEGRVSWNDLLGDLNYVDINQNVIVELLNKGAAFWQTSHYFTTAGHYNIGYVFSQAGVPIKALSKQAGWGSRLIYRTYRWQVLNGFPEEVIIRSWLETAIKQPNNGFDIPDGVDDQLAVDLITKSVVALRETMNVVSRLPNINELDPRNFAYFATHFPSCALSKEEFTNLIRDVRLALNHENQASGASRAIKVERQLHHKGEGWNFALVINVLKKKMTAIEFQTAFGFDTRTALPNRGLLMLNQMHFARFTVAGNEVQIRFIKSQQAKFRDADALNGVIASYKPLQPNGPIVKATTTIANADPLSLSEPLVFVEHHQFQDAWELRQMGSCSLAGSRALVWVTDAAVIHADNSIYNELHHDVTTKSRFIEVTDSVQIEIDGDTYHVRLKEVKTSDVQYEIRGNLWCTSEDGLPVYRGKPRVLQFDDTQVSERDAKRVEWLTDKSELQSGAVGAIGVFVCRIRNEEGELQRRIRMVILPDYASESMTIGANKGTGQWMLKHWGIEACQVSDKEVTVDTRFPGAVVLRCPERRSVNDALHFEITVRGKRRVSSVRLKFEYPQEMTAFVSRRNQSVHTNDHEITLSAARELQAVVKVPDSKVNQSVLLSVEPGNLGDLQAHEGLPPSLFRTTLPVPIDKATHVGFLNFEDFAPVLYRAMRVCQGTDINQYVRMVLETGSGAHKRLLVAKVSGRLKLDRETNEVKLAAHLEQGMTLVATPLFTTGESIDLGVGDTGKPVTLPATITESNEPWLITQKDDAKYQTLPLMYASDHVEITPDMSNFCQIPGLWQSGGATNEALYRQVEGAVSDMLRQPLKYQKDWDFVRQQLTKFGTRGFANLPYWEGLRNNVSLAFAFAAVLSLTSVLHEGERSLLWSVARVQSWRWELISFTNQQPNPIQIVKKALAAWGLDHQNHLWATCLLQDESINQSRALTHKLTITLLQLGLLEPTPALITTLSGELDFTLMHGRPINESVIASAWATMQQNHQIGFAGDDNDDYFKETHLMTDAEKVILKYIDSLPKGEGLEAGLFNLLQRLRIYSRHTRDQGLNRVMTNHLPLVLPILIAFCWEQTANTGYGVERQKQLARKGIYYLTETLLMRDPDITADAFAMAALLEKHLKDNKNLKGRGH